jgi:hypothetical protein
MKEKSKKLQGVGGTPPGALDLEYVTTTQD